MRSVRIVALSLGLGLLATTRLQAQEITSPFRYVEPSQSAGGYVGWLLTDTGELDLGPQNTPLVGARYAVRFSGPLSGEVSLGMGPSRRTVYHSVVSGSDTTLVALDEADMFLALAEAGLRFHLTGPRTWHGIAPYVAASGGLVTDLAGSSEIDEAVPQDQRFDFGPGFAVGVGAGTDWFLTERLSLRLEARDHLWRITTPQGMGSTGQEESEWTHNFALTLGAALHF